MTEVDAVDGPGLERLRGPLTGYCYRLLGHADDADDAVQDTLVRALRARDRYDPSRARLSTWVFRIATNVCLDLLRGAERRALPWDLGPAAETPDIGVPLAGYRWLGPLADSRIGDPADAAIRNETVRLAFVAALQLLPPRQRAVLVLRDVLAFSATEAADVLETSTASVTSALQRARATLAEHRPRAADPADLADPAQRTLLADYVAAFEAHDVDALVSLLAEDVRTGMPPFAWWLDGPGPIAAVMTAADACAGDRLLIGGLVNGSWSLGQYRLGPDGAAVPFALLVVELSGGRITEIVTYLGHGERFADYGLPPVPPDR